MSIPSCRCFPRGWNTRVIVPSTGQIKTVRWSKVAPDDVEETDDGRDSIREETRVDTPAVLPGVQGHLLATSRGRATPGMYSFCPTANLSTSVRRLTRASVWTSILYARAILHRVCPRWTRWYVLCGDVCAVGGRTPQLLDNTRQTSSRSPCHTYDAVLPGTLASIPVTFNAIRSPPHRPRQDVDDSALSLRHTERIVTLALSGEESRSRPCRSGPRKVQRTNDRGEKI
jgi:hypothetical protein